MIHALISHYIKEKKLFDKTDKLLIALSGGADSVALLRLLCDMGYLCEAAHCNFHLRAEESDRDEAFVRELCDELHIQLHVIHFDTQQYAANHKLSIEMAARELRYQWFEQLRNDTQSSYVVVAHHKDDSVETMLLNLIRGTGIAGLTGIQPQNGFVVRPLLCINRHQIIDYLDAIGQSYVTDSTNLQDEYTRNKIRLNLLPMMEELNPSVKESIAATGSHLNDALLIYKQGVEESKKRIMTEKGINIASLLQEVAPESILHEILYPLGFTSKQIKEIYSSLQSQSGKRFYGKNNQMVVKDREMLLIEQSTSHSSAPFELIFREYEYTTDYQIPRNKQVACFDTDKLPGLFEIRKWQAGDKFIPFGMKGRKLISDFMTDQKFSVVQKENQWLLLSAQEVIWVIGERTDNRYRIDENTKRVTEISILH